MVTIGNRIRFYGVQVIESIELSNNERDEIIKPITSHDVVGFSCRLRWFYLSLVTVTVTVKGNANTLSASAFHNDDIDQRAF